MNILHPGSGSGINNKPANASAENEKASEERNKRVTANCHNVLWSSIAKNRMFEEISANITSASRDVLYTCYCSDHVCRASYHIS